jgi:predicted ATPase/class 3 adenylate cyclase
MVASREDKAEDLGLLKGERRQITALFYDLVGSTRLLSELDPEDFYEVQSAIHRYVRTLITRNDGYVDVLLGDGGCAYFGYPVADEYAARKAVSTALAIANHDLTFDVEMSSHVVFRVGVATAPALVGLSRAPNAKDEVVGLAPTLASRIQSVAEPGTVAVANSTYLIVQRFFNFIPLGEYELKGLPGPQTVWRPLSEMKSDNRFLASRKPRQHFVGRERELQELKSAWLKTLAGGGATLFIFGEAGLGKSRLASEAVDFAASGHLTQLVLQCEPSGMTTPFFPIIRLLRSLILSHDSTFDFNDVSPTKLMAALALPGAVDASVFSTLARLIDERASAGTGIALDAQNETFVKALATIIHTKASASPALILVEDFHWADSQTVKVLDHLQRDFVDGHRLILITSRAPPPAHWASLPGVRILELHPMDGEAIRGLVKEILGAEQYSGGAAEEIEKRCGGNPFFAEELARYMRDNRSQLGQDGTIDLFSSEKAGGLQELLAARLAELGTAKTVVQAASVIGRSFNVGLLSLLLERSGTAVDLDHNVKLLTSSGFITKQPNSEKLSFRHELLRESAYQGLLRSTRRSLHGIIHDLLEERPEFAHEHSHVEFAEHAEKAGMLLKAAGHYLLAGKIASQQSALEESQAVLSRALDAARHVNGIEARHLELEVINQLGPVLTTRMGAGSDVARTLYDHGVSICHDFKESDLSKWFPIFWGWWFTAQDFQTQRSRADVILKSMSDAQEPEARLQAQHCKWANSFNQGIHTECLAAIDTGLAFYNPEKALAERTRFGGHDARVCGLGEYGLSLWFRGRTETAVTYVTRALEWAEEIDHLGSRFHALDIALMLNCYRKDATRVAQLAQSMRALSQAFGAKPFLAKANIFEGWALGIAEDPARGRSLLNDGLAKQAAIGTEEDVPVYMEMLAQLESRCDNAARGLAIVQQAITRAEAAGHRFWLAELFRRQALLHHEVGDRAELVAAAFSRSREIAVEQDSPVLLLRSLIGLAVALPDALTADDRDIISRTLDSLEAGEEKLRLEARYLGARS